MATKEKKKQLKKTIKPRKGGSVVLDDKTGKVISDSNDKKSENKVEGNANVN